MRSKAAAKAAHSEQPEQVPSAPGEAGRLVMRKLIDVTGFWEHCEHRQCRRMQACVETQTCLTKYRDVVRWWLRTYGLPYARKRYPTVQWGAPAGVVEPQLDAALAAEAAKTRGEARATEGAGGSKRRRRRKGVPRQELYTPPDFVDGAGGGAS